jgi:hypothetical protein
MTDRASYDRRMDQLRLISASIALAVPAVMFALNAFAVLSILVGRGYRPALYAAIALVAVYLVTALAGGVLAFVAYWVATLVLVLLALPVIRDPRTRSTV